MKLRDFVENPNNPSSVTAEAFEKVVGFLRANPDGLKADRIAYVTDHPAGKFVVLSGNKRLRALKQIHGADAEVPAEWFQDITALTDAQRAEFVVTANVNDGKFDADKLLAMYDRDELVELVGEKKIDELIAVVDSAPREVGNVPSGSEACRAEEKPVVDDLVEFTIVLSAADFKEATKCLRSRSDDLAVAIVEVANAWRA